jgi:hypothetical protein
MSEAALTYRAQVSKVQTLVDGGIRLSLDMIAPTDAKVIMALIEAKQPGAYLECANVVIYERNRRKARKTQESDGDSEPAY